MTADKKIVWVVCTANICRSPMVHALLDHKLAAANLSESVEVRSAGVFAPPNMPASVYGVDVIAGRGLDLSRHRSTTLSVADVQGADLILVMEEAHRRHIAYRAPQHAHKVMLFRQLVGENEDLADPYGLEREAYEATLVQIEDVLRRGWDQLLASLG